MSSRDDILERIRTALGDDRPPVAEIARDYRTTDDRPDAELLDVLTDRLEDYRATVLRSGPDDVAATVSAALGAGLAPGWAARDVVVAPGLPADWRPESVAEDDGRPATDLVAFAAAVTGVSVAIAETGTLVVVLVGRAAAPARGIHGHAGAGAPPMPAVPWR